MNRFIKKIKDMLFAEYTYGIAYKSNDSKVFRTILPTKRYSYADPFVFEYKGKTAIFVELMDYRYGWGTIGAFEIIDNKVSKVKEIIREKNHMSFPNVFIHENELYMIPETYSANNIHLYRCIDFPYKWEKDAIILENVQMVDHALYEKDGITYVVSYDLNMNHNRCFMLDWDKMKLVEFYPDGEFCKERPGGTFFENKGKLMRAIQECSRVYGEYIKLYVVENIDKSQFNEKLKKIIKVENIRFDQKNNFERTHQLSKSNNYILIDYFFKNYYWNKFMRLFYQRIIHPKRNFS